MTHFREIIDKSEAERNETNVNMIKLRKFLSEVLEIIGDKAKYDDCPFEMLGHQQPKGSIYIGAKIRIGFLKDASQDPKEFTLMLGPCEKGYNILLNGNIGSQICRTPTEAGNIFFDLLEVIQKQRKNTLSFCTPLS